MTPFTDEDLNRLKETLNNRSLVSENFANNSNLLALIVRLEAAEKIAEDNGGHDEDCDECSSSGPCSCGYEDNDKAWRKAAGR